MTATVMGKSRAGTLCWAVAAELAARGRGVVAAAELAEAADCSQSTARRVAAIVSSVCTFSRPQRPRCPEDAARMLVDAPLGSADSAVDWSWLARRGGIAFVPPVPEKTLPDAVAVTGNPTRPMTRSTKAVLAVLRLWPAGATVGVIADAAGISRSAAWRGLMSAQADGYAVSAVETVPWRRTHRRVTLWHLAFGAGAARLLPFLPSPVRLQRPPAASGEIPPQFWRLFWSGADPAQMRMPRDASLIGCRLLESFDPAAQGWVLTRFSTPELEDCLQFYPTMDTEFPSMILREIKHRSCRT